MKKILVLAVLWWIDQQGGSPSQPETVLGSRFKLGPVARL